MPLDFGEDPVAAFLVKSVEFLAEEGLVIHDDSGC